MNWKHLKPVLTWKQSMIIIYTCIIMVIYISFHTRGLGENRSRHLGTPHLISRGGGMVFRRGSWYFFRNRLKIEYFFASQSELRFFFSSLHHWAIFFISSLFIQGWVKKIADRGRRTQDDRCNQRNRAKLGGQNAIIWGRKPKPIGQRP